MSKHAAVMDKAAVARYSEFDLNSTGQIQADNDAIKCRIER